VCNPDEHLHFLSNYLTEVSLLDHNMIAFLPSEIAAAAVFLANVILKRPAWDGNLQHYSGFSPRDIAPCVRALGEVHTAVFHSSSLQAIKEKYAHPRFQSVSRVLPVQNLAQQLATLG
jgi:cyclin A